MMKATWLIFSRALPGILLVAVSTALLWVFYIIARYGAFIIEPNIAVLSTENALTLSILLYGLYWLWRYLKEENMSNQSSKTATIAVRLPLPVWQRLKARFLRQERFTTLSAYLAARLTYDTLRPHGRKIKP